ncbi:MAG: UDP-N-acetylmuramoylalanine--D-glutamate ligase [Microgenomates bacterium OLB23]|nr:MAG: UDP-N-acetylmuramoylalanine--D-glutamate ligase [Microgenomates bacterium OLB23]
MSGKKACLAGNIGEPMLNILINDVDQYTYVVLELSSYQLEDCMYAPHIAILLNVYEELHNHKTFEEYRQAKFMIAQYSKKEDVLLYNPHILHIEELLDVTAAKKVPLENASHKFFYHPSINPNTVQALYGVAQELHITNEIVQRTLDEYKALPHRLQHVGEYEGVLFINDSAANHPMATQHALSTYNNVSVLLLGGQNRGFDFSEVVSLLANRNVPHLVLFPNTHEHITQLITQHQNYSPQIYYTDSMHAAVAYAFAHASQGSVCLLSPGAPSYLMYTGFPARGTSFMNEVKLYAQKNTAQT